MKKISLIALIILYIILIFYYFNRPVISYAKTSNNENKIDKTNDRDKTKIKIYFPITDYGKLNKAIKTNISSYINEFNDYAKGQDKHLNQYYTLYILYDEFKYDHIISYVFTVEMYTGGAHPDHYIKTINYDIDSNQIIDIDYLVDHYDNILDKLSISANSLLLNKLHKDVNLDKDMIKEGTKPIKNNFENLIFTDDGLRVYFLHYQVAPYSYGIIDITVPYEELGLK